MYEVFNYPIVLYYITYISTKILRIGKIIYYLCACGAPAFTLYTDYPLKTTSSLLETIS